MTTVYQNFVPPQILALGQSTVYTSSNVTTLIDAFTMTNISSGIVSVGLYLVPSGDLPSDDNAIVKDHMLASEETYPFYEVVSQVLNTGAYIVAETDTNAAVNINVSGRIIT